MSLNIQDLGIQDDILAVMEEVGQGKIYLFRQTTTQATPFSVGETTLELVGSQPFISLKDGTIQNRKKFTEAVDGVYTVKIGLPRFALDTGLFAYINFSNGVRVVQGVLTKVEKQISTITLLEVDSRDNIPKDLEIEAHKIIAAEFNVSAG